MASDVDWGRTALGIGLVLLVGWLLLGPRIFAPVTLSDEPAAAVGVIAAREARGLGHHALVALFSDAERRQATTCTCTIELEAARRGSTAFDTVGVRAVDRWDFEPSTFRTTAGHEAAALGVPFPLDCGTYGGGTLRATAWTEAGTLVNATPAVC